MSKSTAEIRTTKYVFEHHLTSFSEGIDSILSDYEEASVLLTPYAEYRGLNEIRSFFDAFLKNATPEFWSSFKIASQTVEGDIAYLTWSSRPAVPLATDTFLIRDGKILVQTFTLFRS
jgi:hypothetical protein